MPHPELSKMNLNEENGMGSAPSSQNTPGQTHAIYESIICNTLINNQLKIIYERLFDLKQKPDSYIFVDIDTTGEHYYYDEIVELSALFVGYNDSGVLMDSFDKILLGNTSSKPFMLGKHGITEEIRKKHGYPASNVLNSFVEWLRIKSPNYLVAHSAIFHGQILLTQLDKHGIRYALPRFLCTLKMAEAKKLPIRGLSLANLAEYYGCAWQPRPGLTDVQTIAFIFVRMSLLDEEARIKEGQSHVLTTERHLEAPVSPVQPDDKSRDPQKTAPALKKDEPLFTLRQLTIIKETMKRIAATSGRMSKENLFKKTGDWFKKKGREKELLAVFEIIYKELVFEGKIKEAYAKDGLAYNAPPSQIRFEKPEAVSPQALGQNGQGEVSVEDGSQRPIGTVDQTDLSLGTPEKEALPLPSSSPDKERLRQRREVFWRFRSPSPDKERLLLVLSKHFQFGFRPDSIALTRFRRFVNEDLGYEIYLADKELIRFITENGILHDGKVYPVSKETREKIWHMAKEYFGGGARIIFWEEFYAKHESWAFKESVVAGEMLETIFRDLFPELTFTQTYLGYTDKPIAHAISDEILRVWKDDRLLTVGQIAERLIYIPFERIKTALAQNGDFIWNSQETYTHISKFEIIEEERGVIMEIAQAECSLHGYVSITDLPLGEIFERNFELSETAIQNAVFRACLFDGHDKKGKIVSRKGDAINAMAIMKDYCRDIEQCSLDELLAFEKEVTGETHRWIPMEAAYSVLVRIDKETFVAARRVDFDVEKIDEAITFFVRGQYLPLRHVTTFAAFPHCGYPWNLFLLESYCRRFSEQFRFDTPSVNSRNAGAIIRKVCAMSYEEIMADAVAKASIPLEKNIVSDFLFENGYIGKSTTTKADEIIELARVIKARGA